MPITDDDLITVNRATRNGSQSIEINITWVDGATGENKGTYSSQWTDANQVKEFLEGQTYDDLMRAIMLQCLNRNTGALRGAVFDGLTGKTFRVMQRVQAV